MSTFFSHAAYAEDQTLSKTILVTHVMHRGFQTGAVAGIAVGTIRALTPTTKPSQASPATTGVIASIPHPQSQNQISASRQIAASAIVRSAGQSAKRMALLTIERNAGVGALVGAAVMGLMMPGYMYDKETIEWQDRSWRLLGNKGQVEVDSWSLVGAAVGLAGSRRYSGEVVSWRNVVGRAGVGSLVGVVGYMGWRYGVKKGQFQ